MRRTLAAALCRGVAVVVVAAGATASRSRCLDTARQRRAGGHAEPAQRQAAMRFGRSALADAGARARSRAARRSGKGANGPVRRARSRGRRLDLAVLGEFGNPDQPGPTAAPRARCTTRFRSPTGRSTTRPSGRRTSASSTTRTCSSRSAGRVSMRNFYIEQLVGPLHREWRRDRLGEGAVQRGPLRQQLCGEHRLLRLWPFMTTP